MFSYYRTRRMCSLTTEHAHSVRDCIRGRDSLVSHHQEVATVLCYIIARLHALPQVATVLCHIIKRSRQYCVTSSCIVSHHRGRDKIVSHHRTSPCTPTCACACLHRNTDVCQITCTRLGAHPCMYACIVMASVTHFLFIVQKRPKHRTTHL